MSLVAQAAASSGEGETVDTTAKVAAARWIPLRLTEAERSTLRVLEGAVVVAVGLGRR